MDLAEWMAEYDRRVRPELPAVIWLTEAERIDLARLVGYKFTAHFDGEKFCGTRIAILDRPPKNGTMGWHF